MDERTVERYLVRRVKHLGGEIRKVKWIGRRHAPDRRVMLPEFCFWAEVKRPGERPTDNQAREHKRMRRAGERVIVIDSIAQVDEVLALAVAMGQA